VREIIAQCEYHQEISIDIQSNSEAHAIRDGQILESSTVSTFQSFAEKWNYYYLR